MKKNRTWKITLLICAKIIKPPTIIKLRDFEGPLKSNLNK